MSSANSDRPQQIYTAEFVEIITNYIIFIYEHGGKDDGEIPPQYPPLTIKQDIEVNVSEIRQEKGCLKGYDHFLYLEDSSDSLKSSFRKQLKDHRYDEDPLSFLNEVCIIVLSARRLRKKGFRDAVEVAKEAILTVYNWSEKPQNTKKAKRQ